MITLGVVRLGDCWDVIVDDSLDETRVFYSFYRLGKREKTWRNIESGHLIFCSLRLWTDNIDKTVRYCLFMTSTIAGETYVWHQQISLYERLILLCMFRVLMLPTLKQERLFQR